MKLGSDDSLHFSRTVSNGSLVFVGIVDSIRSTLAPDVSVDIEQQDAGAPPCPSSGRSSGVADRKESLLRVREGSVLRWLY